MKARSKLSFIRNSFIKFNLFYHLVMFSVNDEDTKYCILSVLTRTIHETIKQKLLKPCITILIETSLFICSANILNGFHMSGALLDSIQQKKWNFPLKDFFSKCDQMDPVDFVTITKELLNSFMTEAVIISKPVHWFAEQINIITAPVMKEFMNNFTFVQCKQLKLPFSKFWTS